jgi:hypothetical protein
MEREKIKLNIEDKFLLAGTASNIAYWAMISGGDEILNGLVLELLNPGRPGFKEWWKLFSIFYDERPARVPAWDFPPEAELTASLAYLCWLDLLPAAKLLLIRNPDPLILKQQLELEYELQVESPCDYSYESEGTPLHVALSLARGDFVELLVQKGADVNAISSAKQTPLNLAMGSRVESQLCRKMVTLLLNKGANPNTACLAETPLQSALWGRKFDTGSPDDVGAVQMLLDAGADVNAICDDEAQIEYIRRSLRYFDAEYLDQEVEERWHGHMYKSPLAILEHKLDRLRISRQRSTGPPDQVALQNLGTIRELLIKHGARAFHVSHNEEHSGGGKWH